MSEAVKDFDALTAEMNIPVTMGGREFLIRKIPAIVQMMYTRFYLGTLRDETGQQKDIVDLKLDAFVATLNANITEGSKVTRDWVEENASAVWYDDVCDRVLAPFLEAREKKQLQEQQRVLDILTPAVREIVQEELDKRLQPSKNSKGNSKTT